MDQSRVFITGFKHFDLVYVPDHGEVVSQFQGEHNVTVKDIDARSEREE